MTETIGFIGLGSMGLPIATRLLEAGHRVMVYNRTPEKAQPLVERGAARAATPDQAAVPNGIVFTMLADDRAAEAVAFGPHGIVERLGSGGVHVAMSTIAPETARRLAEAHGRRGTAYLAAPVFGRPEAAAAGKLWVMLAGPAAAKARVAPLFDAVAQGVFDYGEEPGAANIVKLAGNFLIASALEAMAEAFTLAEKNGIDRGRLAAMFGNTLFACPIYQNYGRAIAEQRYEPAGFRLALGLKDIELVLDTAKGSRVPMPFASLLHDRLLALLAQGRDDIDWTGLALGVSRDAGLD